MSQIDVLIARLCPDGVPTILLGDVGEFVRGGGMSKADLVDAGVGAVHYGQIHTHYGTWATETKSYISPDLAAKLKKAQPGDLVIATTSEDDKAVAKAVAWIGDSNVAVSGDAYIYRHTLDPRYVSYFFQTDGFQGQKRRYISGTKVRRISGADLARITIQVPPLEVQREIVAILDRFNRLEARLEAELEAELETRRRQYQYYRDQLLSFPELGDVQWISIEELAGDGFFSDGDWVESKDQDPAGEVRLTQLADVGVGVFRDRSNRWLREDQAARLGCTLLKPGDLLIARMPDPLGRACQVPENVGRAVTVVDVAILRSARPDVLPRYVMHAVNSSAVNRRILSLQTGGTRQRVSRSKLGMIRVPVPTVEEQVRIVSLIDKFEAVVSDLLLRLPAELKARRKQYQYYRDRLLTFPEAV